MKSININLILFVLSFILFSCSKKENVEYKGIIPIPNEIEIKEGFFVINEKTELITSGDTSLIGVANMFREFMKENYKINLKIKEHSSIRKNVIHFVLSKNKGLNKEAYTLRINKDSVVIKSSGYNGLFYGMQSLFQLLTPHDNNSKSLLPGIEIKDYPRFEWRGLMLDVSRHFYPKDSIKKH